MMEQQDPSNIHSGPGSMTAEVASQSTDFDKFEENTEHIDDQSSLVRSVSGTRDSKSHRRISIGSEMSQLYAIMLRGDWRFYLLLIMALVSVYTFGLMQLFAYR